MTSLQIELYADDSAVNDFAAKVGSGSIIRAKPDHFEGDVNIVNLLIQITTSTIPIVAMLVAQQIRAKRFIKVKFNGIEVRGENLDKIETFLTKFSAPARPTISKRTPVKKTAPKKSSKKSK